MNELSNQSRALLERALEAGAPDAEISPSL
jgi:hypothetical protein